jgi:Beta-lactamase
MKKITRRQAIETMGAAAAFATGLGRPAFAETAAGAAGIDQALTEAVKSGRVPGVVAMAANDKGMIYSGAFGVRSLGQSQAMTIDSVFWIASMTKAVTTAAAIPRQRRRAGAPAASPGPASPTPISGSIRPRTSPASSSCSSCHLPIRRRCRPLPTSKAAFTRSPRSRRWSARQRRPPVLERELDRRSRVKPREGEPSSIVACHAISAKLH